MEQKSNQKASQIPQLRVAVNDTCQKACFYCRPSGECSDSSPGNLISSETILKIIKPLVAFGVTDVKLTGGEPMLRRDIVDLVRELKKISGIKSLHLITRHQKAGEIAKELSLAGLDCLNFSLDTLDPQKYTKITASNTHELLLKAIKNSIKKSNSVKINTVLMNGVNDDEVINIINFCETIGVKKLKFLDLILDIGTLGKSFSHRINEISPGQKYTDFYFPLNKIEKYLSSIAVERTIVTRSGGLGHPMQCYKLKSGLTIELKDGRSGGWYNDECRDCKIFPCHDAIMALRLTSDGKLQRCLARSDNLVDIACLIKQQDENCIKSEIAKILEKYTTAVYVPSPNILAQKLIQKIH